MIKVRRSVFETNSSSTHSITMCTKDQYQDWKDGNVYWSRWSRKFVTKAEIEEQMETQRKSYFESYPECTEADFIEDFLQDEGYYTFDQYDDIDYEGFYTEFITPAGETVVAFGYYGYDG